MDQRTKRHSVQTLWTVYSNSPRSPTVIPRVSITNPQAKTEYPRFREFQFPKPPKKSEKNPLQKWCKITGWHGVLDCYEADNPKARAFWFLIIFATAFLGTNQIISMLHDYFSEEQWVTNMHFSDAGPQGLPMPNVSLCSLNNFNQSYLDWLDIQPSALMLSRSQGLYTFYQQYLSATPIQPNTTEYKKSIREDLARISSLLARFPTSVKEGIDPFMKNASHSCKATVLACGLTSDATMENGASCCEKNYFDTSDHCIHLNFAEPNGEPLYITTEGKFFNLSSAAVAAREYI